jgi:hypothetical protein
VTSSSICQQKRILLILNTILSSLLIHYPFI